MSPAKPISRVNYKLNENGSFVIENYNQSKPFSNFFPGIAGVWGIPMWVFYVNRGQCIASFGVEAKDKAIMEFQPANKSYRLAAVQGFRTFIKVTSGSKKTYWEPFQNHLKGTEFRKQQTMSITAHDLTLQEVNHDLGLTARVNYFTLPEESYSALVRKVTVTNNTKKNYRIELIDGLPAIVPYGLTDSLNKNLARTAEAWVKVRNLKNKAPYYQLKVEISDTPEVTPIEEGNFFFSFRPRSKENDLLDVIVEASHVFGESCDFLAPSRFCQGAFNIPRRQQTSNRTPAAMSHARLTLKPKSSQTIVSLYGYAHDQAQLNAIVRQATRGRFFEEKAARNKEIIDGIRNYALTNSSSKAFDLYASHTFLDNILRGGLPASLKTCDGPAVLNVYSRKHGDLERDYNYFVVAPTFYSQGNGNYRDVNQNRRSDVWFNTHVKSSHVVNFLNLIQADGYNPLVIKGAVFMPRDRKKLGEVLSAYVTQKDQKSLRAFILKGFMPGDLLKFITRNGIRLAVSLKEFLGTILELCRKQELAEHGEGFWSDHWTYNLDMVESYLSLYPEDLKNLLLNERVFHFYHNEHYVLPRDQRYILTDRGVRQYASVADGSPLHDSRLRTNNGKGDVYHTSLICKFLCLVTNKAASLDPSGIGIEMEADKPNWYDALNGLPGLLGSSVSETFELKRLTQFLLNAIENLKLPDSRNITVFEELASFMLDLARVLSQETRPQSYWQKSNELKEQYRGNVRQGLEGNETDVQVGEIKEFLNLVMARADQGVQSAVNGKGFLATYFYHDVTEHKILEDGKDTEATYVRPLKFKKHVLPLFLGGYVHALRVEHDPVKARRLYRQVRQSGLYDKKLKMYKLNAALSGESEEIGRTRIFPPGWLENESIWLHMEYKFLLELLRCGLFEEFYDNFRCVLVPFFKPQRYGRSILENSSFLVSSAHEDRGLHGQGFVARLSGSTAEFVHMWLLMNLGKDPFSLGKNGALKFTLRPALAGWLFSAKKTAVTCWNQKERPKEMELPKNTYAFRLFGTTLVVYHNPRRKNTFGTDKPDINAIHLKYFNNKTPVVIFSGEISGTHARDIRDCKCERIDVYYT